MITADVKFAILLALGAILPLLLEICVHPGRGQQKNLQPLFWFISPLIGLMAIVGLLALVVYPWLALLLYVAAMAMLVVISNSKNSVLRMVYAAQDSENLRHLFLYPSFYVVHIGLLKLLAGLIVVAAVAFALVRIDQPMLLNIRGLPAMASWVLGVLAWYGSYRLILLLASSILTKKRANAMGLDRGANADSAKYGLFATIFLHSVRLQRRERLRALAFAHARQVDWPHEPVKRPHIIALQGESYMDLNWIDRRAAATTDDTAEDTQPPADTSWPALNALRDKGVETGALAVPCWGAYTMQTEMAVLSGIPPQAYGVAQLNPYQALASRQKVWSIAAALKSKGYETICLHPAKRGFFRRHKAIPNLGFDRFIGLSGFKGADRYGPYVSDEALAERIEQLIAKADRPLFIHAITIESHGPWVAGRLARHLDEAALLASEPTGDLSFALYRQHMNRLLDIYDRLLSAGGKKGGEATGRRARVVGLFGDHQPAHGPFFDKINMDGTEAHDVGYCLGHSAQKLAPKTKTSNPDGPRRYAEEFGFDLLRAAGFKVSNGRPINDV